MAHRVVHSWKSPYGTFLHKLNFETCSPDPSASRRLVSAALANVSHVMENFHTLYAAPLLGAIKPTPKE